MLSGEHEANYAFTLPDIVERRTGLQSFCRYYGLRYLVSLGVLCKSMDPRELVDPTSKQLSIGIGRGVFNEGLMCYLEES